MPVSWKGDDQAAYRSDDGDKTVMLAGSCPQGPYFIPDNSSACEETAINQPVKAIYEVEGGISYAGRNPDLCRWLIENSTIGRVHAKIEFDGRFVALTDEGSVNGTFVNGSRLSPGKEIELAEGDRIMFADIGYIFKNGSVSLF